MKKCACILLLVCVVMGAAFAQQKPAASANPPRERKNAVALDVFQLFKGFIATEEDVITVYIFSTSYERLLVPHFSIGADLDLYLLKFEVEGGDDINGNYFSLAAEGRYYPSADFEKFFLGTTLGYNQLSIDGKTKREDGGFSSLIISLKMGYKLITKSGFYMEPSLAYILSKYSIVGDVIPTPLGWNGGLRLGFAF